MIPIHSEGRVVGVLDIDSPIFNRFTPEDEKGLLTLVKILENNCNF